MPHAQRSVLPNVGLHCQVLRERTPHDTCNVQVHGWHTLLHGCIHVCLLAKPSRGCYICHRCMATRCKRFSNRWPVARYDMTAADETMCFSAAQQGMARWQRTAAQQMETLQTCADAITSTGADSRSVGLLLVRWGYCWTPGFGQGPGSYIVAIFVSACTICRTPVNSRKHGNSGSGSRPAPTCLVVAPSLRNLLLSARPLISLWLAMARNSTRNSLRTSCKQAEGRPTFRPYLMTLLYCTHQLQPEKWFNLAGAMTCWKPGAI